MKAFAGAYTGGPVLCVLYRRAYTTWGLHRRACTGGPIQGAYKGKSKQEGLHGRAYIEGPIPGVLHMVWIRISNTAFTKGVSFIEKMRFFAGMLLRFINSIAVPEPEPQGAASFWWTRSTGGI
jgi:hypothetical protein